MGTRRYERDYDRTATRFESLDPFHLAEATTQQFDRRGKRCITDVFTEAEYNEERFREWPAAAKPNGQVIGHDGSGPFIDQSYDQRSRHYFRNIRGVDLATELSGSELFCSRRPYLR